MIPGAHVFQSNLWPAVVSLLTPRHRCVGVGLDVDGRTPWHRNEG